MHWVLRCYAHEQYRLVSYYTFQEFLCLVNFINYLNKMTTIINKLRRKCFGRSTIIQGGQWRFLRQQDVWFLKNNRKSLMYSFGHGWYWLCHTKLVAYLTRVQCNVKLNFVCYSDDESRLCLGLHDGRRTSRPIQSTPLERNAYPPLKKNFPGKILPQRLY